jgi:hypothetical protein
VELEVGRQIVGFTNAKRLMQDARAISVHGLDIGSGARKSSIELLKFGL